MKALRYQTVSSAYFTSQKFGTSEYLTENGYTWFDFPEEFAGETVKTGLEAYAATYGATVLYSSARNEYAITRMERVLTRTVLTLQNHLKKGVFTPEQYEMSFQYADKLESIHVTLSPQEKMHLQGRIDRIDVAEDEDYVYVKVIDYKSGNKQFDLAALYYGLQLQLVVYLNAAVEMEAHKHPDKEIVPAALLFYHVDDPTVETAVELSDEELNQEIVVETGKFKICEANQQAGDLRKSRHCCLEPKICWIVLQTGNRSRVSRLQRWVRFFLLWEILVLVLKVFD